MSAATAVAPASPVDQRTRVIVSWKTTLILTTGAVLMTVLLWASPRAGDTRFALVNPDDAVQIPVLVVPAMPLAWAGLVLMALLALLSAVGTYLQRRTPGWVSAIFVVALMVSFLAWAGAGSPRDILVTGLLGGAVVLSVPLVYGALGGVIGERAGVVNVAIESQLLSGAFVAAVAGSLTRNPWVGLVAAVLASVVVSLVLGLFTITYRVNQVIVGVVLNVLVGGLTTFLYSQVLVPNAETLNNTVRFSKIGIPLLKDIPVLGPVLFNQTVVVYLMFLTVPAVWFALYRTRWGLRLRAVGEHPQAADTVGIPVERVRYRGLMVAGAVAGMGGAFYTVVSINQFGRDMTAGAGFIALAAVIFGGWDPIKAALAGLLFGFATNLQSVLSVVGSPVPSQFMLMLPYVVTILAVAGLVGKSRAPAASGEPYIKE